MTSDEPGVDLDGSVALPGQGIAVLMEALGSSFRGRIAGDGFVANVELIFPMQEWPDSFHLVPPRRNPHFVLEPLADDGQFERGDVYGYAVVRESDSLASPQVGAVVEHVAFVAKLVLNDTTLNMVGGLENNRQELVHRFSNSLGDWLALAASWVQLLSGQFIDLGSVEQPRPRSTLFWAANSVVVIDPTVGGFVIPAPQECASTDVLGAALSKADGGERPPLAWQVWLRARAQLRRDLRLAVIESATAAEIAVSQEFLRLAEVQGVPATVTEYLDRRANGLVAFQERLLLLDGVPRNNLNNEIAAPRNRAAHRGEVPTLLVAETSVEATRALLAELLPLPAVSGR